MAMREPVEPVLHPVSIRELRPTQMTVGMREVKEKRKRWRERDKKKQAKALGKHRDSMGTIKGKLLVDGLVGWQVVAKPLVDNPNSFAIDEKGRFYVVESQRLKDGAIIDIRGARQFTLQRLQVSLDPLKLRFQGQSTLLVVGLMKRFTCQGGGLTTVVKMHQLSVLRCEFLPFILQDGARLGFSIGGVSSGCRQTCGSLRRIGFWCF